MKFYPDLLRFDGVCREKLILSKYIQRTAYHNHNTGWTKRTGYLSVRTTT